MTILLILHGLILAGFIYALIRMLAAIKSFDFLLIKFINSNQQFYESQKTNNSVLCESVNKLRDENTHNKNMLPDIKRMLQDSRADIKQQMVLTQKLGADIRSAAAKKHVPVEVKKTEKK